MTAFLQRSAFTFQADGPLPWRAHCCLFYVVDNEVSTYAKTVQCEINENFQQTANIKLGSRFQKTHLLVTVATATIETRHVTQKVHKVCNISRRQQRTEVCAKMGVMTPRCDLQMPRNLFSEDGLSDPNLQFSGHHMENPTAHCR